MVLLNAQKITVVILVSRKQSAVREDAAEGSLTCSPWCLKKLLNPFIHENILNVNKTLLLTVSSG